MASAGALAAAFSFAVLGDTPYGPAEERAVEAMIDSINRARPAFVLHVGDFKGAGPCSDELFARRRGQFDRFEPPLVYTPGDNEWLDCVEPRNGGADPRERLAKLRQVFFAGRDSLGRTRMPLEAQDACLAPPVPGCGCGAHPENRAWTRAGVRFVTLNVPGVERSVARRPDADRDAPCRHAANERWLARAAVDAAREDIRGLVVAIQANPWFRRDAGALAVRDTVRELAFELRKPVLLVHGDTHVYRADEPFRDAWGNPLPQVQRLETYGSPFVGWARVTVDPDGPELFRFEPFLEGLGPLPF